MKVLQRPTPDQIRVCLKNQNQG